jgi:hypothetical protein
MPPPGSIAALLTEYKSTVTKEWFVNPGLCDSLTLVLYWDAPVHGQSARGHFSSFKTSQCCESSAQGKTADC